LQIHPGKNVGLGKDYTIFSLIDGVVKFEKKDAKRKKVSFNQNLRLTLLPRNTPVEEPRICRESSERALKEKDALTWSASAEEPNNQRKAVERASPQSNQLKKQSWCRRGQQLYSMHCALFKPP
jgi:hypothetical protein